MRKAVLAIAICTLGALLFVDFHESTAEAKFLRNGVRPGDRSKMHVIRRPAPGARKRIYAPGTRQKAAKPAKRQRRGQQHAWFWNEYSPSATAADHRRWNQALATMTKRRASGKGLVGAATVRTVLADYRTQISQAAARHAVSEALLAAVIAVESRGQPQAVSPKGAQGLMQLMPATAKRFGVGNSFDAQQNVDGGAAYLNFLLREFRGDVLLALAGYNAGEGAVRKHKGVPPFNETRDYVVLVLDALAAMQPLCPSPLKTPRQRCVVTASAG